jgi:hypothetical protein
MSSYQENLTAVTNQILLQSQQEIDKNKSQLIASMFTFYYTKGAKITAQEDLELSGIKTDFQQKIKKAVVKNSGISNNLLNLSHKNAQETNELVTNASICAANIQIATNAIVRLASDVGSIFSIVNAADYGTDVYKICEEAKDLINNTAYQAEILSKGAMELSVMAAEIASESNFDLTKENNDLMTNLLQVVSSDYDSIFQTINSDEEKVAFSNTANKTAAGLFEANYNALLHSKKTYLYHNQELNFNLRVPEKELSKDGYTITFDAYKPPFSTQQKNKPTPDLHLINSCIKTYHLMIVKEYKKSFFSLSNAETLLQNTSQFKTIMPSTETESKKILIKIGISDLLDSDGDEIELGQVYVAFLLADFTEDFKKKINIFENYLSSPSAVFKLTQSLIPPKPETLIMGKNQDLNTITFTLIEDKKIKTKYRCIFLPYQKEILTTSFSNIPFEKIEEELGEKANENETDFFNLTLAEQVAAANYSVVEIKSKTPEESNSLKITGEVQINEETTDNFGHYLIAGKKYIPVILAMCSDQEENPNRFANSLSNYQKTEPFLYSKKQ